MKSLNLLLFPSILGLYLLILDHVGIVFGKC